MMPFQAMRLRSAGSVVTFIAAAGAGYVNGATSINSPSTPAGIANGDGLYAIVYARSALTPPAGWTLVANQANTGTLTQTLFVYRKTSVTTADASAAFTWSQAASGRMGLAYVVARSSSGTITDAQTGSAETDIATSTAYPHNVTVPALTAGANGELFLTAATSEVGTTSPSNDTWTAPAGATLRATAAQPENRLIVATQSRNNGQFNASAMTYAVAAGGSGTNYYSTITIRLAP